MQPSFNFPAWTEKAPVADRARLRLKFMLSYAGLMKIGEPSIRSVCAFAGVPHVTVHEAIHRGQLTTKCAEKLEAAFGRAILPKEFLTKPLNITAARK